jgi:hypothetical protein
MSDSLTSPYRTRYQRKRKAEAIEVINEVWGPNKYDNSTYWVDRFTASLPEILPPNFDSWSIGCFHRVQPAHLCGRLYHVDEKLVPLLERINSGETKPLTLSSCQGDPGETVELCFGYESFGKLIRKIRERHDHMSEIYRRVKTLWTEFILRKDRWEAKILLQQYAGGKSGKLGDLYNHVRVYMHKEDIDEFVQLWDVMFQSPDDRLVKRLRGPIKAVVLSASLTK